MFDCNRETLSKSLVTCSKLQDRSTSLLSTLAVSLLTSFSSYEVVTSSARASHSKALLKITSLASAGLVGDSEEAPELLAQLLSAFTVLYNKDSLDAPSNSTTLYPVNLAVRDEQPNFLYVTLFIIDFNYFITDICTQVNRIVNGVKAEMAPGELPVSLITKNVQISVSSTLVNDLGGTVLKTPSSTSDLAYGILPPTLTLGTAGLSQCPFMGTYAQLSVLQWSTNPYANSKSMKSALLSFTADRQDRTSTPTKAFASINRYPVTGVPAYTLSFQFGSKQNFNFTAAFRFNGTSKSKSNFTIPACTKYNGLNYLPCNGCNLTSYTNYNVTYTCYDVKTICPTLLTRRALNEDEIEVEDSDTESLAISRTLETIDDDGGSSSSITSPATYGTLVRSVVAELSSVLSRNPFTKDLEQSTVVLIFVGCLTGFIGLMLLFLLKRDDEEKLQKTYVKTESDLKAKRLLVEDMKNGRKGDNGALYQGHLSKFKQELKHNNGVTSCFHRTAMSGYNIGLMNLFVKKSAEKNAVYPSYAASKSQDLKEESDTDTVDDQDDERKLWSTEASITEFLHRLFPGHAIFTKKTNAMVLIAVNHDYFKMFGGSTMTRTRTIRFLGLVNLVLVTLFVDTLFFGVFYPVDLCDQNNDKVRHLSTYCTFMQQEIRPFVSY